MRTAKDRWEWLVAAGVAAPEARPLVRRRGDIFAVAAGGAVVVASAIVVRDGTVGSFEKAIFEAINGLPDVLKGPLWVFQLLGLLVTPFVVAALAYFAGKKVVAAALVSTVPLKLFFERWVVKQIVERERPVTTLADVAIIRDSSSAGLSFPSGHAIFAFAMAGLLAPYLTRRWQIVIYTLAAVNGFARIYLGAHNPLDIVSGAGIGVAIAAGINLAIRVPSRSS